MGTPDSGRSSRARFEALASEVVSELALLRRQQSKQQQLVGRLDDLFDAMTRRLLALESRVTSLAADPWTAAAGTSALPAARGLRTSRRTAARKAELIALAAAGVSKLELAQRADGSFAVRVDNGRVFMLPPMLGELLRILASSGAPSGDSFVPFKTRDEIGILLNKKFGRVVKPHAISQNIARLRNALMKRGAVNRYLVETAPGRGARFLVPDASRVRAAHPIADGGEAA